MRPPTLLLVFLLKMCYADFHTVRIASDMVVEEEQAVKKESPSVLQLNLTEGFYDDVPAKHKNDQALPTTNNQKLSSKNPQDSPPIREKREGVARTIPLDILGPGGVPGPAPYCFEREVYGTCRYRTSPEECFQYEWTGYATILNVGAGIKRITSIPGGLEVYPGAHERARVFLKQSCCNPIIQFVATDLFHQVVSSCTVDVRELQDLHPGEIAGIVVGVLLLIIIIAVIIFVCLRRQRMKKLEKETVIFGRSLTRSKSERSETANHHHHQHR